MSVDGLIARLGAVEQRLRDLAGMATPEGLTDPDPPTGERWDWGQVWAHLAEFVPYWLEQVRLALAWKGDQPIPFGRVKSDPGRVGAIERDRDRPVAELMDRLSGHVGELRAEIRNMPAEEWKRSVAHPTMGIMDLARVFDEFLVGHLEQHADQLESLPTRAG